MVALGEDSMSVYVFGGVGGGGRKGLLGLRRDVVWSFV